MLFIEGQQPRGVFVLCAGKAKLSTSSTEGKTIITKISEAGDVLRVWNATISNRRLMRVTAEMMEPGPGQFHRPRRAPAIPARIRRGGIASCGATQP